MSGFRSIVAFFRRLRRSTARSTTGAAWVGIVLYELDLGLLEVAVQLLDVALVELHLAERGGDLGIGQHAGRLALHDEELYLLKLLQIGYRHPFPYGAQGPAQGRRAQSNRRCRQ